MRYKSAHSLPLYPLLAELSAQDTEDQDHRVSLSGDKSIEQGPTSWEKIVSMYDSTVSTAQETVSKAQTAVRDAINYVKTGGGVGIKRPHNKPLKKKEDAADNQLAKDTKPVNDATAMRRHERVLELLHAGSEMGYSVAMVCVGLGSPIISVSCVTVICDSQVNLTLKCPYHICIIIQARLQTILTYQCL